MMNINIQDCDITTLNVDAIVNAAAPELLGGGGVDGAIHRAAGIELYNECKTLGGCATGFAKITKGYNLPAKYVIHTVGPVYSNSSDDPKLLASCYECSMNLAKENNIHSIAFPAISCGVYGYPIDEACVIALRTLSTWCKNNSDYDINIIMSCFSSHIHKSYDDAYKTLGIE